MDYYNAEDIVDRTGCSKSFSYDIIRKLQESFIKDFPDGIIIQGRIPIWYFEEKMHNKKSASNTENINRTNK